jgi:hypothetical protein
MSASKGRVVSGVAVVLAATLVACAPEGLERPLVVPADAIEVEPYVYYLGEAYDAAGTLAEGYLYAHPKDAYRRDWKKKGNGGQRCYGYISKKQWREAEPWDTYPDNSHGITESEVFDGIDADVAAWEDAADGVPYDGNAVELWGDGTVVGDQPDQNTMDERNTVQFLVDDPMYLAWAYVWWSKGKRGEMLECDVGFNDDIGDDDWGHAGPDNPDVYDFRSVLIHELGHCFGMKDMYQNRCAEVTMYGYSGVGETHHRDLEPDDVRGISGLY